MAGHDMSFTARVDPPLRDLVKLIFGDVSLIEDDQDDHDGDDANDGARVTTPDLELRLGPDSWTLIVNGLTEVGPPDYMVPRIIEVGNQRHAARLVDRVGLHAASVDTPAGVIALAGVSGAGKSTLAAAAILAGSGYVADEISAISVDSACDVAPFHRPIGLRAGAAAALGIEIPVTSDGRYDWVFPWRPGAERRSVGGALAGVAIVSRVESPSELPEQRFSAVTPADALARLMQHCVVPADPTGSGREARQIEYSFGAVSRLVQLVPVVDLAYSQPQDGVETLSHLVQRWR